MGGDNRLMCVWPYSHSSETSVDGETSVSAKMTVATETVIADKGILMGVTDNASAARAIPLPSAVLIPSTNSKWKRPQFQLRKNGLPCIEEDAVVALDF